MKHPQAVSRTTSTLFGGCGTLPVMRTSHFVAGVLTAVLSMALVGLAPAHAQVPAADPMATTVTGACAGGPGRMSVTVHAPADGRHRVEVTARGLEEGSRWTVFVYQEGDDHGGFKEFRRVAVDGAWTVATRFQAVDLGGEAYFDVSARERGNRSHGCPVTNQPASPVVGLTECNRRAIAMLARELDDGSTLVRSFVFPARAGSKWQLTLTAVGMGSRQVVDFNDYAGRRGFVMSRVVITGVKDPRLRLVATNPNGRRCFIGVDPPNVTTDAPLSLRGLGKLNALRG